MTASMTDPPNTPFPQPLPPEFHPLRERLQHWLARIARGGRGYQQAHQSLLVECERVRERGTAAQRQLIDDLARLAAPWTSIDALRHLPKPLHADLVGRARAIAAALHVRRETPAWVPRVIAAAVALVSGLAFIQWAWFRLMPGVGSLPSYLVRLGRDAAYRVEYASTLVTAAGRAAARMAVGRYTRRAARSV